MKTLLEIITDAWHAAGRNGKPTQAFIRHWMETHPEYAGSSLSARFTSGSAIPARGRTKLDRATQAWIAGGKPQPGNLGFSQGAFNAFVEKYRDTYDTNATG